MPNEMPFQIGWQGIDFWECVLNAVFSKNTLTCCDAFADKLRRIGFRNGYKFDFLGGTPITLCGGSDASSNKFNIFRDLAHFRNFYIPHLSPTMAFVYYILPNLLYHAS